MFDCVNVLEHCAFNLYGHTYPGLPTDVNGTLGIPKCSVLVIASAKCPSFIPRPPPFYFFGLRSV